MRKKKIPHLKLSAVIDRIKADFEELAEITGEEHISAFSINGSFCLMTFNEDGKTTLDIYREGGKGNGKKNTKGTSGSI